MTTNARFGFWTLAVAVSPLMFAGCGDEEPASNGKGGNGGTSTGGKAGSSGTSGTSGTSGSSGKGGTAGTGGTSGSSGTTGGSDPGGEGGMGGAGGEGGMGGSGAVGPGARVINMTPARFFPEGVALDRNGNFYLGSMDLGLIFKGNAWSTNAQPFISGNDLVNVLGMYAEDGDGTMANPGTLWVCASDAGNSTLSGTQVGAKVSLKAFNLMTGAFISSRPWPAPTPTDPDAPAGVNGFCNDITIDAEGNLYATDSWYPRILKLPKTGRTNTTPLVEWVENPVFGEDKWHLNGIDVDQATRTLYVVENHPGHLWKIPINTDGTPGAVQEITTSQPLGGPDGLKVIAPNLLATAESNGVSLIEITGNNGAVTEVFHGFDGVATIALHEGSVWIVENQGDHFWGPNTDTPADPPFRLVEVPLPLDVGAGARNISITTPRFFPEGVTVSGNNLYVGSMDTGAIHRAAVTATSSTPFITRDTTNNLASVIGMYAHTATNRLYVCSSETTALNTPASATTLKAFNLTSGAFIASWAWPNATVAKHAGTTAEGFCNDITVSADGYTIYATDSWYPRIVRLRSATPSTPPATSDTITAWFTDSDFPSTQWHLNGLDLAPDGLSLYVVENHPGTLWRVPLDANGNATGAAVRITTSRPLRGPDGLKVINATTLAAGEGSGMAIITLSGDNGLVRTISTGLDGIATFAMLNGNAWIVENQADHFWGASGPQGPNANKPFRLVETPLALP
jgi:sugar lactone lactonase YvrE